MTENNLNVNNRPLPIYGPSKRQQAVQTRPEGQTFQQMVQQMGGTDPQIKVSAHAQKRIESRQIDFDPTTLKTLEQVLDVAKTKGSSKTLVMLGNTAYLLSVKDRTLVTAMDSQEMNEHFFTQIDSVYVNGAGPR